MATDSKCIQLQKIYLLSISATGTLSQERNAKCGPHLQRAYVISLTALDRLFGVKEQKPLGLADVKRRI